MHTFFFQDEYAQWANTDLGHPESQGMNACRPATEQVILEKQSHTLFFVRHLFFISRYKYCVVSLCVYCTLHLTVG
jgi:hypothetical protein